MMTFLWFVACASPHLTEEGAVAPTLARLDSDASGTVTEAEYVAVLFNGVPFGAVDKNLDGALSAQELLDLVSSSEPGDKVSQPPSRSTQSRARKKKSVKAGQQRSVDRAQDTDDSAARARREGQAGVRLTLEALREEVQAVCADCPLPSDEEIEAAGTTSDLGTAVSRAVLLQLETAAHKAGVGFPAALRAEALATRPVVASYEPEPEGERLASGPNRAPPSSDAAP